MKIVYQALVMAGLALMMVSLPMLVTFLIGVLNIWTVN